MVGKAALNERTLEDVHRQLRDCAVMAQNPTGFRPGGFIDVVSKPSDHIKNILYDGTRRVFEVQYENAPAIFSDDGVTWTGHVDLDLAEVQELRRDSSY